MTDQIEAIDLESQIKKNKTAGSTQRLARKRGGQNLNRRGRRNSSQQAARRINRPIKRKGNFKGSFLRRTGVQQLINRRARRPQSTRNTNSPMKSGNAASSELRPNIVFKGLGSFVTDYKLREICQAYGPMDMCKLDRDSFGNIKPQGIGLVKFENIKDAEKIAFELDGVKIVEDEGVQQTGGQISVKLIDPNDRNWRSYVDGGILNIKRRTPFNISRNRINLNRRY